MELIVEFLVSIIGEVVLGSIVELLAELGMTLLFDPFRELSPVLALVAYGVCGGALGFGSAWLVPEMLLDTTLLRTTYLIVAPLGMGALMAAIGAVRRGRGQSPIRLDSFLYGWLFAFAFCGARWLLAAG